MLWRMENSREQPFPGPEGFGDSDPTAPEALGIMSLFKAFSVISTEKKTSNNQTRQFQFPKASHTSVTAFKLDLCC